MSVTALFRPAVVWKDLYTHITYASCGHKGWRECLDLRFTLPVNRNQYGQNHNTGLLLWTLCPVLSRKWPHTYTHTHTPSLLAPVLNISSALMSPDFCFYCNRVKFCLSVKVFWKTTNVSYTWNWDLEIWRCTWPLSTCLSKKWISVLFIHLPFGSLIWNRTWAQQHIFISNLNISAEKSVMSPFIHSQQNKYTLKSFERGCL